MAYHGEVLDASDYLASIDAKSGIVTLRIASDTVEFSVTLDGWQASEIARHLQAAAAEVK